MRYSGKRPHVFFWGYGHSSPVRGSLCFCPRAAVHWALDIVRPMDLVDVFVLLKKRATRLYGFEEGEKKPPCLLEPTIYIPVRQVELTKCFRSIPLSGHRFTADIKNVSIFVPNYCIIENILL